jgi:hypothetical protein
MAEKDREKRAAEPTERTGAPIDVTALLTDWLVRTRKMAEPDTLESCDDYARRLDDRQAAALEARELCERLRRRVATWVYVRRQ